MGLWIERALAEPGVLLLRLNPQIHRDPADQLLVSTARVFDCPLMTEDSKFKAATAPSRHSHPPIRNLRLVENIYTMVHSVILESYLEI
ncbi:MAG: hypothetical protein ABSG56_27445 [Bryobacteraceae bacterium]